MGMVPVVSLAEFLLARVADDEAVAHALVDAQDRRIDCWTPEATDFVERFDPSRVLAECEAKKKIIEAHVDLVKRDAEAGHTALLEQVWWSTATLELLALPYADHPDYREEWKP